ncbi:MAG: tRNA (guanosine(37)-N1)-methyltransferase TrmD [Candidatus Falkowbacteria bacterium]|nr:tRNA (guanosine(37)-N1)-methyltransferase TrmD [Candidatus Falkowbacteria bacterium]
MLFRVITIFPEVIDAYVKVGMLGRAIKKNLIKVIAYDLRAWTKDKHNTVDDTPYGGGAGMLMKAEPVYDALKELQKIKIKKQKVILLSAKGKTWNQQLAKKYAKDLESIIFICGRYEGIDERIMELVDEEISIGDYVLTGGELGAMTIIDSVARLLPEVLGNSESLDMESHSKVGILEYPQYTKPEVVTFGKKKYKVPPVLLSGNHAKIKEWRMKHLKTKK